MGQKRKLCRLFYLPVLLAGAVSAWGCYSQSVGKARAKKPGIDQPPAGRLAAEEDCTPPRPDRPASEEISPKLRGEMVDIGALRLTLDQKELTARDERGGVVRQLQLATPHPCQLHRHPGGAVRVVQRGGHLIVLVECSVPRNKTDCDTHIRSVRVTGKTIELSPKKQRVAGCPPAQWDEYMFTWFWHLPLKGPDHRP